MKILTYSTRLTSHSLLIGLQPFTFWLCNREQLQAQWCKTYLWPPGGTRWPDWDVALLTDRSEFSEHVSNANVTNHNQILKPIWVVMTDITNCIADFKWVAFVFCYSECECWHWLAMLFVSAREAGVDRTAGWLSTITCESVLIGCSSTQVWYSRAFI